LFLGFFSFVFRRWSFLIPFGTSAGLRQAQTDNTQVVQSLFFSFFRPSSLVVGVSSFPSAGCKSRLQRRDSGLIPSPILPQPCIFATVMLSIIVISIFVLGYVLIALEHTVKIDKAASALVTGVLCWTVYATAHNPEQAGEQLMHHLSEIAGILFFVLGAMTIVELIDTHEGFDIITSRITTTSKQKLLVIIVTLTFFLSAVIDNLTTAIVMVSLCGKILKNKEDRWWFAGMIVIAANAGGAWSPLGDVTTTMLWIGGQITAGNIILKLILPSLAVCLVPLLLLWYRYRSQQIERPAVTGSSKTTAQERNIIFYTGMLMFILVPVFKITTHLPPFMGMLLALGIMWIITSMVHYRKEDTLKNSYSVASALQKIDSPSILFFMGILLAVAALQSLGLLQQAGQYLNRELGNEYAIGSVLGVLSSIVDNVPLVAAAQGMYSLEQYPPDHNFWEFLALTTGTGGSMIIIGSAAGVAVMGLEDIKFGWYIKKIGWLAALGFVAGILVFLLLNA
jgi:Na+/H+ antiporter NhaD/arsenite permease-like protein